MHSVDFNFTLKILVFYYFHSYSEKTSSSEVPLVHFETTVLFVLCINACCYMELS